MGFSWHCFTHITSDPATGYRGIQSIQNLPSRRIPTFAPFMPSASPSCQRTVLFCFAWDRLVAMAAMALDAKNMMGSYGIHCFEEAEIEQQVFKKRWYLVFVWKKRFVCLFGTHVLAIYIYIWTCMERPVRVIQIQRCCLAFFLACVPEESASLEQNISAFPAIQRQDVQLARRLRGERT